MPAAGDANQRVCRGAILNLNPAPFVDSRVECPEPPVVVHEVLHLHTDHPRAEREVFLQARLEPILLSFGAIRPGCSPGLMVFVMRARLISRLAA